MTGAPESSRFTQHYRVHSISAMQLVRTPKQARKVARVLLGILLLLVSVLIFAPWVQTAKGEGRVINYSPLDRPQNIEATIDGRVVRWHVQEGTWVNAGDSIVDIADNDQEIMARLRGERDAVQKRVDAHKLRVKSLDARIEGVEKSRVSAMKAAESRVKMAAQRVVAAQKLVEATRAGQKTAKLNYTRQKGLFDEGLTSQRNVELAELDLARADTELARSDAGYALARSEEMAVESDRLKVDADTGAVIDDAKASQAGASAEIANGQAEFARIEVRLARQASQSIKAPRAGTILKLLVREGGEMVKAGDAMATLVPGFGERAVELWVTGNDAPLVSAGRHVRLQFEGWPALQFSGWPSVAVGTFGGKVAFVDATDDGKGKFRMVVIPDDPRGWPEPRYLRQGVKVQGWALLNEVRLGYELWRQFNGFPASVAVEPTTEPTKGTKEKSK